MNTRKGIILAGGSGTRLYPVTMAVSKSVIFTLHIVIIFYALSKLYCTSITQSAIIFRPDEGLWLFIFLGVFYD
ncbi:TPA: hypothetical protein JHK29_000462 [Escherichia coli]|nr:hypothetical protein [Escherichia coli]